MSASVPEPSYVIYGSVQSGGSTVQQEGMHVEARHNASGAILSDTLLGQANAFKFVLNIPLEANIGTPEHGKARVNDIIDIYVAGTLAAKRTVTDRGAFEAFDVELPSGFDSDGDGIFDAQEIQGGTDPNNPNDPVKYGHLDIDNDGLSNAAEFLTGSYNPNADADGDGYSNEEEYQASTDPNSSSSRPLTLPAQGDYSPLHAHASSIQYVTSNQSTAIWNEDINGVPTSIVPMYWNNDTVIDFLITSSQGTAHIISMLPDFVVDEATSSSVVLSGIPIGDDVIAGLANVDAVNAPELWAYSRASDQLYLYQRQPGDTAPYGTLLWQQVELTGVNGHLQMDDIDGDGIVDVIASGVDLLIDGLAPENTIAWFKGDWDGTNYSLEEAALVTNQSYINNSAFIVLNNIGEAGFDLKKDLLIQANDQKYYVDLSFNGLNNASVENVLLQSLIITEGVDPLEVLTPQADQLNTGNVSSVFAIGNIDLDADKTADLIQYTSTLGGNEHALRIVPGVKSASDQDTDGILDFKDIDPSDEHSPLPNGNVDFDGDGVPYALDATQSGKEDADNDGIVDSFEIMHGLNPMDAEDATTDSDSDGRTAYQEFIDGTDPNDASSVSSQEAELAASVQSFEAGSSDLALHGDMLLVASQNSPEVKVYNVNDLTLERTIYTSDPNGIVKIMPHENWVILGAVGGSIEIWDMATATRVTVLYQLNNLGELKANPSSTTDMVVNGNALFSLHANGKVYHWNLDTLSYVDHWKVYDGFVTNIFSLDELLYIQASSPEKVISVWNYTTQTQIYSIVGNAECCDKVVTEYFDDNLIIANTFDDDGIYVMNVNSFAGNEVAPATGVTAIKAFTRGVLGTQIYVGKDSGVIDWYSMDNGSLLGTVAAPYAFVRDMEITSSGFVSLHSNGTVYLWRHQ